MTYTGNPSAAVRPTAQRGVRAVAVTALLVAVGYLTWRLVATMAWGAWWIAVPLWLLELWSALSLLSFTFALWDIDSADRPQPRRDTDQAVAVLIATTTESLEVLLPTIASAVALEPAHETWVLDDGNRPEVRELAFALGANYLARTEATDGKAGSLNHALGLSAGMTTKPVVADLVVILDADHVAEAGLITDTLGYFDNPQLALVQTPQEFYNTNAAEHAPLHGWSKRDGRNFYNEQALFYRVIQPGKNRTGSAYWCGTNALVRVAALRAIGGVATGTRVADVHTTVRLHRNGWQTVYHNDVLARGLAASDAIQYQKQRTRWGVGAMQLLRSAENPLTSRELSIGQRLSYANSLLSWFDSWRLFGLAIIPIVVVASGATPVHTNGWVFAGAFAVNVAVQQIALRALGRGWSAQPIALVFETIRMQVNLRASLAIFGRRRGAFTVSGASLIRRRGRKLSLALLTVLAASAACLIRLALRAVDLRPVHHGDQWAAAVSVAWGLFVVGLVAIEVRRVCSERFADERRASIRFPSSSPARLDGIECTAADLSLTGARLTLVGNRLLVPGQYVQLAMWVKGRLFESTAALRSVQPTDDGLTIGVEYAALDVPKQAELALSLFRTEHYELGGPVPLAKELVREPVAGLR